MIIYRPSILMESSTVKRNRSEWSKAYYEKNKDHIIARKKAKRLERGLKKSGRPKKQPAAESNDPIV